MAIKPINGFYVHDQETDTDGVAKYDYGGLENAPDFSDEIEGVSFSNYATAQTNFLSGENSALYIEFIMPETMTERQYLYQGNPSDDSTQIIVGTSYDVAIAIKNSTATATTQSLSPGGKYVVGICADGRVACDTYTRTVTVGTKTDTTPMLGARRTTLTYKFTGSYCRIWGVADASDDAFMEVFNDPTGADYVYNVKDINLTQWESTPDNSNPFTITGTTTLKYRDLAKEIDALNGSVFTTLSLSDAFKTQNCYVTSGGAVTGTRGWTAYCFKNDGALKKINRANLGTNSANIYAVAYYSSYEIAQGTLISGVFPRNSSQYNYSDIDVPNCKMVVLFNRNATVASPTATITAAKIPMIENELATIKNELSVKARGSVKAIYKNIQNTNDFTFVGDELWTGINQYQDGVATEYTTVYRYKVTDGGLSLIGTIDTDFGHWNVVDYSPENDCLLFTNAANEATTEGNWFAVVPHPLELGSVARLENCGTKYDVDVGFKVQAVWGDSNLGENNIVYLFSNNAQTVTKVMLSKGTNGDFNGQYTTLETVTHDTIIGVGGGDFWGDTLYIGIGSRYRLALMSMTDYTTKEIERKFYYADGTAYNGSTQGVCVDDKYLWVFINVGGQSTNFLIQYYR